MVLVLGVCAVTYLNHPDFASRRPPPINDARSPRSPTRTSEADDRARSRSATCCRSGIKGLFCAMMIMGLLAGDSGHMHSWGSIFVQDVVLPLRKTPMTPRQHIWALRWR